MMLHMLQRILEPELVFTYGTFLLRVSCIFPAFVVVFFTVRLHEDVGTVSIWVFWGAALVLTVSLVLVPLHILKSCYANTDKSGVTTCCPVALKM